MNSKTFRILAAILLLGFMAHRGYYTRKVQHSANSVVEKPDLGRGSQFAKLLALPAFGSTILYILHPRWISWSAVPLPDWLRWMGVITAGSGFGLLQWAQQTLSKNWSDAPQFVASQSLVTGGPYRWIRHPIYTAFLLILGSMGLISSSWFIGGLWIGMTALDIAARIRVEEGMMNEHFGDAYRGYLLRTGRLFPRLMPEKRAEI